MPLNRLVPLRMPEEGRMGTRQGKARIREDRRQNPMLKIRARVSGYVL